MMGHMEFPAGFFLKPVDGSDDLIAFQYDFGVKALDSETPTITETEDGDLIIEGWAAVFEGVDRQGENFAPGAFQRGVKSFLDGSAPLCFHHKRDQCLGKVLDLREEEGKGLKMKARVDFQPESSPLRYIYNQIKKGTLSALSVGGFFKRGLLEGGRRIVDMDFTEISVTPVPIHPRTNFAVVAGKALVGDLEIPNSNEDEIREDDFLQLQFALDALGGIFEGIAKRNSENVSKPAVI